MRSRAKNSQAKVSSEWAESWPCKGMWAKISCIYDMGGFKPILVVEGGNLAVFSNVHIKLKFHCVSRILFNARSICSWQYFKMKLRCSYFGAFLYC